MNGKREEEELLPKMPTFNFLYWFVGFFESSMNKEEWGILEKRVEMREDKFFELIKKWEF